jgi:transcriptional regulator with XRE-family HTH domain
MSYDINNRILSLREKLNVSQTEFGKSIGVSRGVIANIELSIVDASTKPLLLQQIVKEYNVDPYWLETGEGEMFLPATKDDAIMQFAATVLADKEDSFRRRFVTMLSNLSDDGWKFLEKTLDELTPKNKKEQD